MKTDDGLLWPKHVASCQQNNFIGPIPMCFH